MASAIPSSSDPLLHKLSLGLSLTAKEHREANDPTYRKPASVALYYVLSFLREKGVEKPALLPLEELLAAMDDLDAGRSPQLLQCAPYSPKNSRIPVKDAEQLWTVAAAVTLLEDGGTPRKVAIAKAANLAGIDEKEVGAFYTELRKTKRPKGQVKGQPVSRRPGEIDGYHRMLALMRRLHDIPAEDLISKILRPGKAKRG